MDHFKTTSLRALNEQMTCAVLDGFFLDRLASTRPALHASTSIELRQQWYNNFIL